MLFPEDSSAVKAAFERDIMKGGNHLIYNYAAHNPDTGEAEKWKYEMWFYNEDRIVYAIHGGPMAGRINYQKADYQCIREGELWQCNWLEETGTICSLVYDIPHQRITTLLAFSQGHWEQAEAAHGNKRNAEDLARWRQLAEASTQRAGRH